MATSDPLATTIRQTYFARFNELELEYQLHFASRLYSWSGDPEAAQKLAQLRTAVMPGDHAGRLANLQGIADELAAKDYERDVNNYAKRKPFFDAYPQLLFVHNVLFRIRHWLCIYGVDERDALFTIMPQQDVVDMIARLQRDQPAVLTLSTYAINLFYLYEKLYRGGPTTSPQHMYGLKSAYDYGNKKDVQLLLYLYTHCILGETLFYYQPISQHLETYRAMLAEIEQLVAGNYDHINLDNKFEFLVCANICSFPTKLAERIHDEATASLSSEGFIVDMHNQHINPAKQSFMMSEHRNVLFLMSLSQPRFVRQPIAAERPN